MNLSAEEIAGMRQRLSPLPEPANISKEEAALLWANLPEYKRFPSAVFVTLLFGPAGLILVFLSLYR